MILIITAAIVLVELILSVRVMHAYVATEQDRLNAYILSNKEHK